MEGKPIDFRVSTVPGKWGEKVCMRLLDKSNTALGLDTLITHAPVLAVVREMIQQPYGIIYVTGPTGSGKTTTLYSALAEINDPGVNISTAEDPVEYDLPGVTQIQAASDIGLTFAAVLRAFLRQDPDVLLVGETRDKETAHTAVEAALTGHLVFTTLHTNSAAVAFTRLTRWGSSPSSCPRQPSASSHSGSPGVCASSARSRCPPTPTPPATSTSRQAPRCTAAVGCAKCGGKGVKGRVGHLRGDAHERTSCGRWSVRGARAEEIHAAAVEQGMIDLKRYAALLLTGGMATVEDVMSVVSVEA